jgi:DNA-binding MarR family transcriptional regulator
MAESPSLEISQRCLAVRLRRVNRAVTGIYDDALRPLGIKVSQLNIMVVADRFGELTPSDVGRVLQLEASTLSRNLERMRKRGWIEPAPSKVDGRLQPFRLTHNGRELLAHSHPLWAQAQERAKALLGEQLTKSLMSSPAAALGKR